VEIHAEGHRIRLDSKKLTIRQKDRIRAARDASKPSACVRHQSLSRCVTIQLAAHRNRTLCLRRLFEKYHQPIGRHGHLGVDSDDLASRSIPCRFLNQSARTRGLSV
jgi:hypothetical protein